MIIPYETVGSKIVSTREFLNNLGSIGVKYHFYLRDWDKISFPFANKGFFPFKKKIPDLLLKKWIKQYIMKRYLILKFSVLNIYLF